MAPLETLVSHCCKWRFIGSIGVIDAIGVNGANESIGFIDADGVNGAIENIGDPMVQMASMTLMAPLTPVASLISMCNDACEM